MNTNIYGLLPQFCENASFGVSNCAGVSAGDHVQYSFSVGGTYVATNSFPASGCGFPFTSVCLTDAQLRAEIHTAMTANGWTGGPTHMFFIYTPDGVASCFGSSCSYSEYCAYHYSEGSGSGVLIYANMAYPLFGQFDVCEDTKHIEHPNGDVADAAISISSHESNEAITDAQFPSGDPTGWADDNDNITGGENGDKCAYYYGKSKGPNRLQHNQVINGDPYYVQLEWSNADGDCLAAPLPPTAKSVKPNSVTGGDTITVSGSGFYPGETSVSIDATACTSVTELNSKKLTCTVGGGTPAGSWPVVVTTFAGSGQSKKNITVS